MTIQLYVTLRLGMSGAVPLLPHIFLALPFVTKALTQPAVVAVISGRFVK